MDDIIDFESAREEHLRQWVRETEEMNALMRAQGIEPNYTCSFEDGVFKEYRKS